MSLETGREENLMSEKIIYRLNDDISFRKCSLHGGMETTYGDCTNWSSNQIQWKDYFECNQYGIHFHCTKHPEIELNTSSDDFGTVYLSCPQCGNKIEIENINHLRSECLRMLNIPEFKGAKLIRLDDWYVPEVKKKDKTPSDYFITSQVKTDKDGDTMIVLYIGHQGDKDKVQYFIKPEKLQLSSDHKDMDPAKILSKIEVTFKDRKLTQEYDEEDENNE